MFLHAHLFAVAALMAMSFASSADGQPSGDGLGETRARGEASPGETSPGEISPGYPSPGAGAAGLGVAPRFVESDRGVGAPAAEGAARGFGGANSFGPPTVGDLYRADQLDVFYGRRTPGQLGPFGLNPDRSETRAAVMRAHNEAWLNNVHIGPKTFAAGWYPPHPDFRRYEHPRLVWAAVNLTQAAAWLETASLDAPPAAADSDWLYLGVFALDRLQGGRPQMVQLAVNRAGELQGVQYDQATAVSYSVAGRVGLPRQLAVWRSDATGHVTFSAPLSTLTSDMGELNVHGPLGDETWVAARLYAPLQLTASLGASHGNENGRRW